MTYEEALRHLGKVADYLKRLRDARHPLLNHEVECLIADIDAVQEGLQQGLTQNPDRGHWEANVAVPRFSDEAGR